MVNKKTKKEIIEILYKWKMECDSYTKYPPRENPKDKKRFKVMREKSEHFRKTYSFYQKEIASGKMPLYFGNFLDLLESHNENILYGDFSMSEREELLV